MYVYTYIYMYVYIHVYMSICIYKYILYVHIYMYSGSIAFLSWRHVYACGVLPHGFLHFFVMCGCDLNILLESVTRCITDFHTRQELNGLYHVKHTTEKRPMTHSYMWHDSGICVTWLFHVCQTSQMQVASLPFIIQSGQDPKQYLAGLKQCYILQVSFRTCWRTHTAKQNTASRLDSRSRRKQRGCPQQCRK